RPSDPPRRRFPATGAAPCCLLPAVRRGTGAVRIPGAFRRVTRHAMNTTAATPANAEKRYTVHRADLPLSCPTPEMALWASHPRAYRPVQEAADHSAQGPCCSAVYELVD